MPQCAATAFVVFTLPVGIQAQTYWYDGDVSVATITSSTDLARVYNILGNVADYNCTTFVGVNLEVGDSSANSTYNYLAVQNGAHLTNSIGLIGNGASGYPSYGSYNQMLVTGSGSLWTNTSDMFVGYYGSNNSLTIASGASVTSFNGEIGFLSSSDGNSVTVTGTGSSWAMTGAFEIGNSGADNSLTISAGGRVSHYNVDIGLYSSSTNNSLLLSGAGSRWITRGYLRLGMTWSTGNSITVEDGALAVVGDASADWVQINYVNGSAENHLRIDGGFVAIFGDQTADIASLLLGGKTLVWDSAAGAYVSADGSNLLYSYCDQAGDAASVLGDYASYYTDLLATLDLGYTIVWAVPEPATYALLGGLGALGFVIVRRRRVL